MLSRYREAESREFQARYAAKAGEDLAERVYTSRLLGADPSLVLHGGGNTSVKSTGTELDGAPVELLYVKGSGWDLAKIEPAGFSACRLAALLRYAALTELSDEDMVRGLRSQMLDPKSPTPSVEALLHAIIPARFVDHTHSTAVLSVVNQPDSERRAREIWGERLLFVPYVMPGFALARHVFALARALPDADVMILDKHGIFTWGDTGRASYEAMTAAVTLAEHYVTARTAQTFVPGSSPLSPEARIRAQGQLSPLLRGAIVRRRGKPVVARWRDTEPILALLARADAVELTQIGTLTPDHVIRTKPWPLYLGAETRTRIEAGDTEPLDAALDEYEARYRAYFAENARRSQIPLTQLAPTPALIAVAGLGVLSLGNAIRDVEVAADVYHHTSLGITAAAALGSFRPVSLPDLFDVEYWSLEQAKLQVGSSGSNAFSGRVAVVTGGASGIGLSTARRLLELGAGVVIADVDSGALAAAETELTLFAPSLAVSCVDVRSAEQAESAIDVAVARFGGLDIVVSNAGTAPTGQLHEPLGDAALRASLEVNLIGHQNIARAATQVMLRQRTGGCLLFNASKSAFNQGPDFGPYAVAKAALVALMRQYAVDLGPHSIRANAVNADRIRTPIFSEALVAERALSRGVSVDDYFRANLLRRETTAQDVADAFAYLASANATTGTVLTVDGGNPAAFPR